MAIKDIDYTCEAWAPHAGIHADTLRKRLTKFLGRVPDSLEKIPAATVFKVMIPNLQAAKVRESEARALKIELANAVESRELLPRDEVEARLNQLFLPVVELFRALPADLAPVVCPDDTARAYRLLTEYVESKRAVLRELVVEPANQETGQTD